MELAVLAILLILVIVLGYSGWGMAQLMGRARPQSAQLPKHPGRKPTDLIIQNVGPGGVIRLENIGPELDTYDVTILTRHLYRQGRSSTWVELEGDRGEGEKLWLTIEEDDGLDLTLGTRKLRLDELGVTLPTLRQMDEDETGTLQFEGKRFHLTDSDRAVFYRHADMDAAESFYYWEFATDDAQQFISVERWEDGSFDITYGIALRPGQVTVYSLANTATT